MSTSGVGVVLSFNTSFNCSVICCSSSSAGATTCGVGGGNTISFFSTSTVSFIGTIGDLFTVTNLSILSFWGYPRPNINFFVGLGK